MGLLSLLSMCSSNIMRTVIAALSLLLLVLSSYAVPGMLIPLYSYPEGSAATDWNTVKAAASANPSIPFVVIINPDNGPGSSVDTTYRSYVNSLVGAGCKCLGYISTKTGSVSASTVTGNMDKYKSWYPNVTGFFLDEMAYSGSKQSYYQSLTNYAVSIGYGYTMGNPGTATTQAYFNTVNNTVIFESKPLPRPSEVNLGFDISASSFIAYTIPGSQLNQTYISQISEYVSLIYITDAPTSDPYQQLPSYFNQLLSWFNNVSPVAPVPQAPTAPEAPTPSSSSVVLASGTMLISCLLAVHLM